MDRETCIAAFEYFIHSPYAGCGWTNLNAQLLKVESKSIGYQIYTSDGITPWIRTTSWFEHDLTNFYHINIYTVIDGIIQSIEYY
jgi:hypothetical protein